MRSRVLILGGTAQGRALAARLASIPGVEATYSLSGATRKPLRVPVPTRAGGFGGAAGMADYLRRSRTRCVVDATHPFATSISTVAARVCTELDLPLAVLSRPPWTPGPDDHWHRVEDLRQAADLVEQLRVPTVFLTIGSRGLAPFVANAQPHYLVRSIEPPALELPTGRFELILERGPFDADSEVELFKARAVNALVTKNSGGQATYGKVLAARRLRLPVVMVERPVKTPSTSLFDIDQTLDWIARQMR